MHMQGTCLSAAKYVASYAAYGTPRNPDTVSRTLQYTIDR